MSHDDTGPGRTLLVRSGPLATITFDNPGRRNALTSAMYDDLRRHCLDLAADPGVRVVALRGAGGAFAAGTDVADLEAIRTGEDGVRYEAEITRVLDAVGALPVPVVGIVEGPAVGGGLAILARCDLVYATPTAVFGAPVARTLGNCVSPATTSRMRAALGRAVATELLLTGRLAGAEEALSCGFLRAVAPIEELDAMLTELVERVTRCAPLSVAAAKTFGRRLDDHASAVPSADVYAQVYGSADFHEGVQAFRERRPPVWNGR